MEGINIDWGIDAAPKVEGWPLEHGGPTNCLPTPNIAGLGGVIWVLAHIIFIHSILESSRPRSGQRLLLPRCPYPYPDLDLLGLWNNNTSYSLILPTRHRSVCSLLPSLRLPPPTTLLSGAARL